MSLKRWLDDQPMYPEVYVKLVDALREYIRCVDRDTDDFVDDGQITPAEATRWYGCDRFKFENMLRELEVFEIDPWLEGLLRSKGDI